MGKITCIISPKLWDDKTPKNFYQKKSINISKQFLEKKIYHFSCITFLLSLLYYIIFTLLFFFFIFNSYNILLHQACVHIMTNNRDYVDFCIGRLEISWFQIHRCKKINIYDLYLKKKIIFILIELKPLLLLAVFSILL